MSDAFSLNKFDDLAGELSGFRSRVRKVFKAHKNVPQLGAILDSVLKNLDEATGDLDTASFYVEDQQNA